jgi:hypothetical protein
MELPLLVPWPERGLAESVWDVCEDCYFLFRLTAASKGVRAVLGVLRHYTRQSERTGRGSAARGGLSAGAKSPAAPTLSMFSGGAP